jgi:hypothetical protein
MENFRSEKKETNELLPTEILLHFMRHSHAGPKGPGIDDDARTLSEKGLEIVGQKKTGYESDIPDRQKMVHGSPRIRSQETAMIISGIDQSKHAGSRQSIDERLNFHFDFEDDNEFAKTMNESFSADYLKKLVEESDELAEKVGDNTNSTYSRMASNVAKFIDSYVRRSKMWNDVVNNKYGRSEEQHKKDGGEYDPRLERFIGTHQGVVESFVAKVLENKYGKEKRDEFIKSLNNMGFELVEGVDVKIIQNGDQKEILLTSGPGTDFKLDEKITEEDIRNIIE